MDKKETIKKLEEAGLRFAKDEREHNEFLLGLFKNRLKPEVKDLENKISEAVLFCRQAGFKDEIVPINYKANNV